MGAFGASSKQMLEGVHPKLVEICEEAVRILDFTVLDGVRTSQEQAANIARGVSWTKNSKHLIQSDGFSHAVDLAPFVRNVDWHDVQMFCVLAGVMCAVAWNHGVKLRWGGDWNSDNQTDDENPRARDLGHFELAGFLPIDSAVSA